jgi:hypothetical protein
MKTFLCIFLGIFCIYWINQYDRLNEKFKNQTNTCDSLSSSISILLEDDDCLRITNKMLKDDDSFCAKLLQQGDVYFVIEYLKTN